jgi:peroxiredoxin
VQMLPTLHDLYDEFHPRGAEFVGINSDGPAATAEEVRAFLRRRPAPYPMVLDDGDVGGRYNVMALPHMVVLGRDGDIRKVFWGITSRNELARALTAAQN